MRSRLCPSVRRAQRCPNCRQPLLPALRDGLDVFSHWVPGQVGRFRLRSSAGSDRNLYIAEAHDGSTAFVQFLPEYADADSRDRGRFDFEVTAWQRLDHNNLVRVLDNGTEAGLRYYVHEAPVGETLEVVLARANAANRPMPFEMAYSHFGQLCRGLQALHDRGVRHGELQPATLWLTTEHGLRIVPPWAARFDPGRAAELGRFAALARPTYYAPEQIRGDDTDIRSDVYTAGIVVYEMLTGFLPTGMVRRPSVVNPSVPAWFETLLAGMLEKDSAARPAALGPLADAGRLALSEAGLNRVVNAVGGALLGAVAGGLTLYYKNGNIWIGALIGLVPGLLAGLFLAPGQVAPRQSAEMPRFPDSAAHPATARPLQDDERVYEKQ